MCCTATGQVVDGIAGKAGAGARLLCGLRRPIRQQGPGAAQAGGFQGLKIGVPGAVAAEVVKSFGGVPTTVDASEVYLALQRGTVDGTNFPLTSFYDRKLYETDRYLTLTNVSFDPDGRRQRESQGQLAARRRATQR